MKSHRIRLVSVKVLLAVQLIDDYSDEMVSEECRVYVEGELRAPIRNKSGYFVFTELQNSSNTLVVKSKYYYDEYISFELETYKDEVLMVVRLIPNSLYPFPSRATLIRGTVKQRYDTFRIKALSEALAYGRVIKPYSKDETSVEVVGLQGKTHKNMMYCMTDPGTGNSEYCSIKEILDGKRHYSLKSRLVNDYPRGALLLWAKEVRVDERNQFIIYFGRFPTLSSEFAFSFGDQEVMVTVNEGEVLYTGCIDDIIK